MAMRAASLKKGCIERLSCTFRLFDELQRRTNTFNEAKHMCEEHDNKDACKLHELITGKKKK